jgi:NAD(P)H-flavin reductase
VSRDPQGDGSVVAAAQDVGPIDARIVSRAHAAHGQLRVALSVAPDVRARHRHPGQFVELAPLRPDRHPEKGFFALLNAPGEGSTLDLLVRTDAEVGGEAVALLVALPDGAVVPCSLPMGSGFPLERARGRGVRVVATGTAIAPARAAIVHLLRTGEAPVLSLDFGVRSPAHVPLEADLLDFVRSGIDVAIHHSHPSKDGADAPLVGALAHEALFGRWDVDAPRREVVIAVGQLEMVAAVRARWQALGGDPADVLHNY